MEINIKEQQDICIIFIEGEVDMFTSPDLYNVLMRYFKKKVRAIIVDLKKVSFMDSSGIATLMEGVRWSKKENKHFVLAGLGTNILNSIALTKLDNVFNIKKDMDDAYKELCAN